MKVIVPILITQALIGVLWVTTPAEARHHYRHHGHRCPHGQILIVHEGRCVTRAAARRIMADDEPTPQPPPARHRVTRHVKDRPAYVKVIDAPPAEVSDAPDTSPVNPCGPTETTTDLAIPFVIKESRMGRQLPRWQF